MAVANMAVAIGGYGMKVVPTVAVAIIAMVVILVATILVEFLVIPMVGVMNLFTAVAEMMVGKATQEGVRIVTIMAKATQVGMTAVTVPATVKVMDPIAGGMVAAGKAAQAGVPVVSVQAQATQVGRAAVTVPTTVKVMEPIPGRLQQQRRYSSRNWSLMFFRAGLWRASNIQPGPVLDLAYFKNLTNYSTTWKTHYKALTHLRDQFIARCTLGAQSEHREYGLDPSPQSRYGFPHVVHTDLSLIHI